MSDRPGNRASFAGRELFQYLLFVVLFLFAVGGMLYLQGKFEKTRAAVAVDADAPGVTVILDAGHGGEDGGAVGTADGREIYEKDLNLSIALLLRDFLEADGINVVMTRTEDVLLYDRNVAFKGRKKVLDLAARLHVGQSVENATFVSIHMNAFTIPKYSGLQVYYSPNNPASAPLAEAVQTLTRTHLQPENHRKIKPADESIFLLDRLTVPAILIECGFLSNPEECARLATQDYRRELAFLFFLAIRSSLDDQKAPTARQISGVSTRQDCDNTLIFPPVCDIMVSNPKIRKAKCDERHQNDLRLLLL